MFKDDQKQDFHDGLLKRKYLHRAKVTEDEKSKQGCLTTFTFRSRCVVYLPMLALVLQGPIAD